MTSPIASPSSPTARSSPTTHPTPSWRTPSSAPPTSASHERERKPNEPQRRRERREHRGRERMGDKISFSAPLCVSLRPLRLCGSFVLSWAVPMSSEVVLRVESLHTYIGESHILQGV